MKLELALCYYPTSVALIDDNEAFLANLQQLMKIKIPAFKFAAFSNPGTALKFANDRHNAVLEKQRNLSFHDNDVDAERFILNTLNKPSNLRNDNARFSEISVVVVDLDMPDINGLEFCRKVQNPNIKKILLTGVEADQQVIRAFNDNEIHYYINKSDDNMSALLEVAIRKLQHQYFLDVSLNWKSQAIDNYMPLFSDSSFANYFKELCETLNITEYYFQTHPSRYQLEIKGGSQRSLLVCTDDEILSQLRILYEEGAPLSLIRKVESRTHLPYFPTIDGFYVPEIVEPERCLYQAKRISGDIDYYCAMVDDISERNSGCIDPLTKKCSTLH